MRIVSLAAAAALLATTAIAVPAAMAETRSLSAASKGSHHSGSAPAGRLSQRRSKAAPGISPHLGMPGILGFDRLQGNFGRRHGRHGGHDGDWGGYGYGYGGYDSDGYVDTIPMFDEPGFFAEGGFVTKEGNKPVYNYDRGYPYEFYNGGPAGSRQTAQAGMHCRIVEAKDVETGKSNVVRTCSPY